MSEGFIRLSRKTFAHYLWGEDRVFSRAEAWIDLIQSANFDAGKRIIKGSSVNVPRGGIVASERFLSDRWKWSRNKVRAFLALLRDDSMIEQEKDQDFTVIILCNYESYNSKENEKRPRTGPSKDQSGTSEGPPKDQRKEGKEGREGKENEADASSPAGVSLPAFDRFWLAYPRKEGKSEARGAFTKTNAEQVIDTILAAVERQKSSPQWTKDDGQFIPQPRTWLNQKRWEDEGIMSPSPRPKRRFDKP